MNQEVEQKNILAIRLQELARKRQEVLALRPEEALTRILEERQPAALVHSFSEEDFYFLVHDIGVEDALELLSLASDRQWEYILDTEVWHRDRIQLPAVTRWLNLLMKADPRRLVRWLFGDEAGLAQYYLFRNIELAIREHDQDPSDLGRDFATDDDTFYVRFREVPPGAESETALREARDTFLWELLRRLSAYDHVRYQQLLLESVSLIPAEAEEEIYRLRNIRRAEKGFLPTEEAVGVYQPMQPAAFRHQARKVIFSPPENEVPLPVPLSPAGLLEPDNLFVRSLTVMDETDVLQQLQAEFAGLCNRVISADQQTIREREALRGVVRKVCGYVSIGLTRLTGTEEIAPSAALIRNYPLAHIFRVGYGRVLDLKWRAEKWRKASWFQSRELPLSFWGEEWLGVLGGLLVRKPLCFDNYQTGVLYREFYTEADIRATEEALNEIMAIDSLLALADLPVQADGERLILWKNLMLTHWARQSLGLPESFAPIPLAQFKPFFNGLWKDHEALPRIIGDAPKEAFLQWLADRTGLSPYEVSQQGGKILESLFEEIAAEYGAVAENNLDPRYVLLFLLA